MNWPLHFWGNLLWKIFVGVILLDVSHRLTVILVNQKRIARNQGTIIENQRTIVKRIDGR